MPGAATTPKAVIFAIGGSAGLTALLVAARPHLGFDHAQANASIDTIAALTAALVAFLVYTRVRQKQLLRDVVLSASLLTLALGNIVFSVLPTISGDDSHIPSIARIDAAFAGAVIFAVGGWLPRTSASSRLVKAAPGFAVAAIVVGSVVGAFIGRTGNPNASVDNFVATGSSGTSILEGVTAACFMVGAWGLARRAVDDDDQLLRWFAVAAVFAATSRFDFAISASATSSWMVAGNVFRLAFYCTLGIGAAREIHHYSLNAAKVATIEERRRVARDLHDGMAQELAFIASQARWLDSDANPANRAQLIASAAQRALDESRRAIAALTRPMGEPLDVAIAQAAEDVARRLDVQLDFAADDQLATDDSTREALVRIVREAVSNAGRHSGGSRVEVRLRRRDGVLLCVHDDGSGFDTDAVAHRAGHLGLVSMRERAEACGGSFSIRSANACGTTVEVWVP
jgi:signal transduction histidine kinase